MPDERSGNLGHDVLFDPAAPRLVDVIDLARTGPDTYRAGSHGASLPFIFGGQLAAQGIAAAYRTVANGRRVHSLHAMFLTAGDPREAVDLAVTRLRDGGSFSVRQVTVTQGDRTVFSAFVSFASFQADTTRLEHADSPANDVPEPENLRPFRSWIESYRDALPAWWSGPQAIDLRYVEQPPHVPLRRPEVALKQQLWMRTVEPLPEDAALRGIHECAVAYASDMTLLDPVLLRHRLAWFTGEVHAASLDHTIWFHRPIAADRWMRYEQDSPVAHGGRALCRGEIFDPAGLLCVSVAQEGLIKSKRKTRTLASPNNVK